jgi:hypothetical protein
VDARTSIESSYGEIRGSGIGGTFSCKSGKSDIYLEEITALCTFNSTYGNIHLTLREKPPGITVKAARTAMVVNTADFGAYRYELRTSHAAIYVPEQHKKYVKQTEGLATSTLDFAKEQRLPLIKVNTTFSPITIRTNP